MNESASSDGNTNELEQLLGEALAGSTSAKNELFGQLQNYLTYIAQQHQSSKLAAKAGASDIVQQTLMHAAEDFSSFRGSTAEQFRGWLRQILVNEARELNRRFTAQRRSVSQEQNLAPAVTDSQPWGGDPADSLLTPCSEAMAKEQAQGIMKSLEKLPEEMRLVIQLRNWERLQFNEIAERMGISLSSAAKLWYRALAELQRLHSESEPP